MMIDRWCAFQFCGSPKSLQFWVKSFPTILNYLFFLFQLNRLSSATLQRRIINSFSFHCLFAVSALLDRAAAGCHSYFTFNFYFNKHEKHGNGAEIAALIVWLWFIYISCGICTLARTAEIWATRTRSLIAHCQCWCMIHIGKCAHQQWFRSIQRCVLNS